MRYANEENEKKGIFLLCFFRTTMTFINQTIPFFVTDVHNKTALKISGSSSNNQQQYIIVRWRTKFALQTESNSKKINRSFVFFLLAFVQALC